MKRISKIVGYFLLGIVVLVLSVIVVSGRFYLFKGVQTTYLVGKKGPAINEAHIFHNRPVPAGKPQPWKISEAYNSSSLTEEESQRLESLETASFLVFHKDQLFFETYFGDYNASIATNSFSMAKSIVSVLTGIAIDNGYINSLDDKAVDYLPWFTGNGLEDISLRHLITMSSGLGWTESGKNPFSDNAQAYYSRDVRAALEKQEKVSTPGEVFNYQSGNTQVLGMVVESATKKTLSEFASKELWQPLGAESDALWNLDHKNGYEKCFCCFYATPRDFARIGKLFLNGGMWNDKQIVSSSWVKESTTPAPLQTLEGGDNERYGYSWWVETHHDISTFYMRGILGQYVIVIPSEELIIVRTGSKRGEKTERDHPSDFYLYIDIALRMIKEKEGAI